MKKLPLLLLILALVAGCALPARQPAPVLDQPAADINVLWQLSISQGRTLKFSGLLGTRREADGLYYVLLDGTGVTLLEARLTARGEQQPIRELGFLREHRLRGFLADSLYRIFLLEPADEPCGRNFLLRLCRKEGEEQRAQKTARAGPVTLWSVEYLSAAAEDDWTEVTFTRPWLGVSLTLTRN
jgi:hypothetical protein